MATEWHTTKVRSLSGREEPSSLAPIILSYVLKTILCSKHSFSFTPGPPSEEDCYADIEAAYYYLRHVLRVPSQNIVLYGRSLGSGPSCYLATKTALTAKKDVEGSPGDGPVGGLILHAPFLSVYRVVVDAGCTLYGDKFVNVDILPMVRSPTLLIHGTSDQIVPFHHSERLFEAIPKEHQARPLYIDGMSHNNVHAQVRPMFVDRLTDYLRDHVWPKVIVRKRGGGTAIPSSVVRNRILKLVEDDVGCDNGGGATVERFPEEHTTRYALEAR